MATPSLPLPVRLLDAPLDAVLLRDVDQDWESRNSREQLEKRSEELLQLLKAEPEATMTLERRHVVSTSVRRSRSTVRVRLYQDEPRTN